MNIVEYWRNDLPTAVELVTDNIHAFLKERFESQSLVRIAFSGGRSPRSLLEALSKLELPWHQAEIHLVDERWESLDSGHSNQAMVMETFFQNSAKAATLVPLPDRSLSREEALDAHHNLLDTEAFSFDLILLGMGEDGHTASLFPGDGTSTEALNRTMQRPYCATEAPNHPRKRVGMSLATILGASELILLFTGHQKRDLYNAVKADLTSSLPIARIIHQTEAPVSLYWAP